jgi:hypothetical protein
VVPIDALSGTSLKRSRVNGEAGLRSSALIPVLCHRGKPRAASPRSSPIRPGCLCR